MIHIIWFLWAIFAGGSIVSVVFVLGFFLWVVDEILLTMIICLMFTYHSGRFLGEKFTSEKYIHPMIHGFAAGAASASYFFCTISGPGFWPHNPNIMHLVLFYVVFAVEGYWINRLAEKKLTETREH